MRRKKRPGLIRTAARTAVISGTATAVSGRVANRQNKRHAEEAAAQLAQPPPKAASRSSHARHGDDIVGRLQQLAELKASGAINEREFTAAKAKLLQG